MKIKQYIPAALFCILTVGLLVSTRQATALHPTAGLSDSTPTVRTDYSVSLSVPSGFYDDDFSLTLSAPDGFIIYYTLDGSLPNEKSSVYTKPLTVTDVSDHPKKYSIRNDFNPDGYSISSESDKKAYILRAIGIDENGISTPITTATYFVGYQNLPENSSVFSLVTDPDNLFDSETGIYVLGESYYDFIDAGGDPSDTFYANYFRNGMTWERPVHIDYFNSDKKYVFSQEAGIRINGNSSRDNAKKSLRLYARKKYDGNRLFTYPLFGENIFPNSFILRNGTFENQFLPTLVDDRNISTQSYSFCTVFIDGEYWGEYYLLERYDSSYFENYYHVENQNVSIIKDGSLLSGSADTFDSYTMLLEYISENDMSIAANYDYICTKIDMQSYIDYYCTQLYLNNRDFCETKNTVLWCSNQIDDSSPYADGRWRYALTDLDFTLSTMGSDYTANSFYDTSGTTVVQQTNEPMLRAFLQSPVFCQQFVTTFMDMENVNFDAELVCPQIDMFTDYIDYPDIWKEFFIKRPEYINQHLADTFHLTGTTVDVTLSVNDTASGNITLNTITPDLKDGTWTGQYFTDYPITVTAHALDGYSFDGWLIDGISYPEESLSLPLTENGISIESVFTKN